MMRVSRVPAEIVGGMNENALDRVLTITRFPNSKAFQKREVRMSLREAATRFPKRIFESRDSLPWLKLAKFGLLRSKHNSLRTNLNVVSIDGIEGDYDGEEISVEEAAAMLRRAGVAAIIYTSPSHTPDKPRWRVLCPCSLTLLPRERERLMARLMGVFGGTLDPFSFTLSQAYLYGGIKGALPPQVMVIEGLAIDLASPLDATALDKTGMPYGQPKPANDDEQNIEDDDDTETEPDVDRIKAALDRIPVDALEKYSPWLNVGLALHYEFSGSQEGLALWHDASQFCDYYDPVELEEKWESFGNYEGRKITGATIYQLAKLHAPLPAAGKLIFETPAECESAPARGYIIKRLLAPRDVACIFGAPGGGKSTLAPYLCYQVALGEPVFELRTKRGSVFYVAPEDAHGMRGRLAALKRIYGDAPQLKLVSNVSDLLEPGCEDLSELTSAVHRERPAIIVIDTLALGFRGLEENDAAAMGRVIGICRDLTIYGAAVVLIHHGTKADGSTPRGHSSLWGALDVALQLKSADGHGIVKGKLIKNRNGPCDLDIAFRIRGEELGTDEDGDPISAATLEALSNSLHSGREKLTASETEALKILIKLEAEGQVREADWRSKCVEGREVCGSDNLGSRQTAMRRAVEGLARKQEISTVRDLVLTRVAEPD